MGYGAITSDNQVEGKLVVAPVTDKKYSLKELLDGVTKRNIHGEIDTGPPVGKELW